MLKLRVFLVVIATLSTTPFAAAADDLPPALETEYVQNCKQRVSTLPDTNHNLQDSEKICSCIKDKFEANETITAAAVRALVAYKKKYGNGHAPEGVQHSEDLDIALDFEGQLYFSCLGAAGN
ncbi:MAG: hypothetical protein HRT45_12835 [Bdellovibrionales bacterium]|nr:hypothetical protein [Bdellovibrionales bacterium]